MLSCCSRAESLSLRILAPWAWRSATRASQRQSLDGVPHLTRAGLQYARKITQNKMPAVNATTAAARPASWMSIITSSLPRHSYSARRCRILLVATTCVNQPKVSVIPGLKYWNMRLDSFHNAERCDVQDGLTHATARQECGPTILAVASFQLLGLQSANIPLLINCHLSFG
jgi:hypothetical protein